MQKNKVHMFDVEEAKKYGIECAILLYNMRFWLEKNKANDKNVYKKDGVEYYWTYNSVGSWLKLFPYMTKEGIRRKLEKLEELGVILTDNFNTSKYDRTKWYTIKSEFCICQEDQIHLAEIPNGNGQSEQPIPYINTYNKQDISPTIKKEVKFVPPTMEELLVYLDELSKADPTGTVGGLIDRHLFEPYVFMGYYEGNGWKVAGKPMKNWKGTVRTWVGKEKAKLEREMFEENQAMRLSLGLEN